MKWAPSSARSNAPSAPIAPTARSTGICPNCGGDLEPRPMRKGKALAGNPASTQRVGPK